ncbi:MAG: universal stress protein [Clostridiales bacterium]|nr:universal stress protein [Clostridiales bacterium]
MINKSKKNIMICVTQQKSCERLIHRGIQLRKDDDELFVIHVVKDNWKYFGELKESDAMEYLFEVSKNSNASLTVLKSPDIELTLSEFAKKNHVNIIIMGESKENEIQQNMIKRLKKKIKTGVKFDIVSGNN